MSYSMYVSGHLYNVFRYWSADAFKYWSADAFKYCSADAFKYCTAEEDLDTYE